MRVVRWTGHEEVGHPLDEELEGLVALLADGVSIVSFTLVAWLGRLDDMRIMSMS